MPTKRELEERVAELEDAIEQVNNLTGHALDLEEIDNSEEMAEE